MCQHFLLSRLSNIPWHETLNHNRRQALESDKNVKMVLRAMRTSTNVSTKLLMSLFDKQIAPSYPFVWFVNMGYPIFTQSHLLRYLPEVRNTQTTASKTLHETCGCDIPFTSARRVGKASSNGPRRILISLTNIQDKETVISSLGKY